MYAPCSLEPVGILPACQSVFADMIKNVGVRKLPSITDKHHPPCP